MKLKNTLGLAALALALFGCSNTGEGLSKDASENGQKSAEAGQKMAAGASESGKNMQAATLLTPKVKMAIVAEKRLSESMNLINVNSSGDKVTLEGHVTSEALKTLAGEIATKTLRDNKASQSVDNQLVIKP